MKYYNISKTLGEGVYQPPLVPWWGMNLHVHLRVETLNILGSQVPGDKVAMLDDNNGLCDFSTARRTTVRKSTPNFTKVWYPPVNKMQPFKNLTINSTMKNNAWIGGNFTGYLHISCLILTFLNSCISFNIC